LLRAHFLRRGNAKKTRRGIVIFFTGEGLY